MARVVVSNNLFSLRKENRIRNDFEGKNKKFESAVLLESKNSLFLILAKRNTGEVPDGRQVFIAFHEDSGDFTVVLQGAIPQGISHQGNLDLCTMEILMYRTKHHKQRTTSVIIFFTSNQNSKTGFELLPSKY